MILRTIERKVEEILFQRDAVSIASTSVTLIDFFPFSAGYGFCIGAFLAIIPTSNLYNV